MGALFAEIFSSLFDQIEAHWGSKHYKFPIYRPTAFASSHMFFDERSHLIGIFREHPHATMRFVAPNTARSVGPVEPVSGVTKLHLARNHVLRILLLLLKNRNKPLLEERGHGASVDLLAG